MNRWNAESASTGVIRVRLERKQAFIILARTEKKRASAGKGGGGGREVGREGMKTYSTHLAAYCTAKLLFHQFHQFVFQIF